MTDERRSINAGSPWRWLALPLLPAAAYLAIGTDGLIVLALPQIVLALALWKSQWRALRSAALVGAVLGALGVVWMRATHPPDERRYLAAAVLFGTLGAAIASVVSAVRGRRKSDQAAAR